MKVYEKIINNFNDTQNLTKEDLEEEFYNNRITTPCSTEKRFKYASDNIRKFKKQIKCNNDCLNCLRKYLDMNIKEEQK